MIKKLKNDFPIFKQLEQGYPLCYLDNAASAQKPTQMIEALVNFYSKYNANIGRAIYHLAEEATSLYEGARLTVAQFINADKAEIVFTKNATEGINLVAYSWGATHLKKGDEILLSELEHHANILPWQRIANQTGATLRYIPVDKEGRLQLDQLDLLLTQKTKLVSITHSSNAIGTYVDVNSIIKKAHAVGAKVLVDACQTAPHQKTDVKQMDADFLVFSGYKVMGPTGIGILFIKKELQDAMQPMILGGGIVQEADWHTVSLVEGPKKFESGTPPIAQAIGLGAAIHYLEKTISFDELKKLEASLCTQLIDGLQQFDRVHILGPVDQLKKSGHLVSFTIDGLHPHDIAAFLDTQGICVRSGHFCAQPLINKLGYNGAVRASFYLYNTKEDVDRLVQGIKQLLEKV